MTPVTHFRYHTETINGREIEKPLPKRLHAVVQKRIMDWLTEQLKGKPFEVLPELDVLCGPDRYVPDVVVADSDAEYKDDMLNRGAVLIVEIMSPGQTITNLFSKAEAYVRHGTGCVWLVWPKRRQAWVVTRESSSERSDGGGESLTVFDQLGGHRLELPLAELFLQLPETEE